VTKTVFITGGSKRLGQAVTKALHHRGWNIALHYGQSKAAAISLADTLNAQRPESVQCYQADLSNDESLEAMLTNIEIDYPSLDAIINNAAVFAPSFEGRTSRSQWDQIFAVNLKAPFFICQRLNHCLTEASSIINICDVFGRRPLKDFTAYSASKAGLIMLTRSLALELAPKTRVNGIAPGALLPPELQGDSELLSEVLTQTPLGTLGGVSGFVQTLLFILHQPNMTGQIIPIDGGLSIN